jgi:hypothetical protein
MLSTLLYPNQRASSLKLFKGFSFVAQKFAILKFPESYQSY